MLVCGQVDESRGEAFVDAVIPILNDNEVFEIKHVHKLKPVQMRYAAEVTAGKKARVDDCA